MKKLICLTLCIALAAMALTGCRRRGAETTPEATDAASAARQGPGYTITDGTQNSVPDPLATLTPQQRAAITVGANGDEDLPPDMLPAGGDMAYAQDVPQDEPVEEAEDYSVQTTTVNTASFQYAAVMDENVDFTFNYPSDWENVPGIYTVCYRQRVESGQFPARVAVTRKKLVHTPDGLAMTEQLTSYLKNVSKQYDKSTFQVGVPTTDVTMLRRKAYANTYLAYWGNIEVKGYVIGVAVDRTLYVFHFCASYADYNTMPSAMQYMISSLQLKEEPKKK